MALPVVLCVDDDFAAKLAAFGYGIAYMYVTILLQNSFGLSNELGFPFLVCCRMVQQNRCNPI